MIITELLLSSNRPRQRRPHNVESFHFKALFRAAFCPLCMNQMPCVPNVAVWTFWWVTLRSPLQFPAVFVWICHNCSWRAGPSQNMSADCYYWPIPAARADVGDQNAHRWRTRQRLRPSQPQPLPPYATYTTILHCGDWATHRWMITLNVVTLLDGVHGDEGFSADGSESAQSCPKKKRPL